jgi:two-component system NarL family sensor kinase
LKTARDKLSFRSSDARAKAGRSARALAKLRARLTKAEKTIRQNRKHTQDIVTLLARLSEAEATIRAIRSGEVDVVVVTAKKRVQLFTLEGAEHAYRVLIESMNEGALTLTDDKTILYANQCFARMVKCPLEQVTGSSFRRFISAADRALLRPLMKKTTKTGSKMQVLLHANDGSLLPAQISVREMVKNGTKRAIIGMVVTDMTEARRTEELLRALTHRVVQAQEAERGRVALELHDNITQLLCAVLFRSQVLVDKLSLRDESSKTEAIKLREMLGTTAEEVERISRNLGPSLLDHLGLVAVLREARTEFTDRTGVSVTLACTRLTARLPADTELALYRILQESLRNVEKHARARNVSLSLRQHGSYVQLVITDDGIGFDADLQPSKRNGKGGLGLLSMRERATYVGGMLKVSSVRRSGTEIDVRIPLAQS